MLDLQQIVQQIEEVVVVVHHKQIDAIEVAALGEDDDGDVVRQSNAIPIRRRSRTQTSLDTTKSTSTKTNVYSLYPIVDSKKERERERERWPACKGGVRFANVYHVQKKEEQETTLRATNH